MFKKGDKVMYTGMDETYLKRGEVRTVKNVEETKFEFFIDVGCKEEEGGFFAIKRTKWFQTWDFIALEEPKQKPHVTQGIEVVLLDNPN